MKKAVVACITSIALLTNAFPPNSVIDTMYVGVNPSGVTLTPDNKYAYVANSNNYGIQGNDTVSVLNLDTMLTEKVIADASFNQPGSITMNNSGKIAYVTNSNGSTVTMVDTATNMVLGNLSGFDGPSGMLISPDGKKAYVNNYGGPGVGSGNGQTVSVVDLVNSTLGSPITVGRAPASMAMSSDGAYIYTVNYVDGNPGTGTMSVIDTKTNAVVGTIGGFSGPFNLVLTPDNRYAYVTNFGSNNFAPFGSTVSVVDLQNGVIAGTIDLGIQPSGIAITPDGRFVYVTNYNTLYPSSTSTEAAAGQGSLSIIDTKTDKVIAPAISVGQSPANIAISSNGDFAYVTNHTSNTVSVIALQPFTIEAKGCAIRDKYSKDFANKLTWTSKGSSLPASYSIYRDAQLTDLIATLSGNRTEYVDYRVKAGKTYTYYLVGTSNTGMESNPVVISITKNCQ